VGRLITLIENRSPAVRDIARALAPYAGGARAAVVGITGAPGVGKSTLTGALVGAYRAAGERVGVLAVDPTSPFSGGALLGDRVRMQQHATDEGVFIRSMATRGRLGGLAAATPQAVRVLEAAGCTVVLVETVGVGQSEVDIAELADTTLVLVAPGMGDAVQAAKAGILEVGDVYVVTKSDREGADRTARELRQMLAQAGTRAMRVPRDGTNRAGGARATADDVRDAGASDDVKEWRPPIVRTAAEFGEGVEDVRAAIARHRAHLEECGRLEALRRRRIRAEIEALAFETLRLRAGRLPGGDTLDRLADQVREGAIDPYTAADRLLGAVAPGYG